MYINIVFHNIYKTSSYEDDFGYSIDGLLEIIDFLEYVKKTHREVSNYRIYFDDGYKSLLNLVLPSLNSSIYSQITAAITVQFIGKDGYLSRENVLALKGEKIQIVSHGVSHAALAIYDKETDSYLLDTPAGGKYANAKWGIEKVLSQKEVEYQLLESKYLLETLLDEKINEFVFPFGLYNDDTLRINRALRAYKFLTTCDFALDSGKSELRPRYLVYGDQSVSQIKSDILEVLN